MTAVASVSFAGLSGIRGADFVFSRGVTPSSFTLYLLPQDNLDATGTLTFSYDTTAISFSGCALSGSFVRTHYDGLWPLWAVTGFDRRWKWKFSTISGDWNRRMSDGTLDTNTQKTPAELAGLLLQALGESNYDTSLMPASVKPRALWKNQRADLALQDLCDKVACEVVLNHQLDRVEIWPAGVGSGAPTGAQLLPKYRYTPRVDNPGSVQVVCGESWFQHKLKLAAVLRNYTDGKQKKMADSEIKPPAGWDNESVYQFPSITDTNKQTNAFEQAWREYRVIGQQDGSLPIPNCPFPITSLDQYLLSDGLLETETDLDGYKRNLPCYIDGDYWPYGDSCSNVTGQRYTGAFQYFSDRKVVRFPFPIFKLSSTGAINEPTLYLTTAYRARSTTGQIAALVRSGALGGGEGTLILRRPELFAIYSSSTAPGAQTNTESTAAAEADAYIALFQQKYAASQAAEVNYGGLVDATLNGYLAQISWSVRANAPAQTKISEVEELDVKGVDRKERRRREQLSQLVEAQ